MARQKRSTSGSGGMRGFYLVIAAVAVVGIAAIAYAVTGGGGEPATEPVVLEGVEDPRALYAMARANVLGDSTAPVKIVEFGDFQCGACGSFATRIKPTLKARYIDTGVAQLVFYDFPLVSIHAHAFLAARASRCAEDQGRYWDYHDVLFARQATWVYARTAPTDLFVGFAEELGLDAAAFEGCLNSDRHAEVVTANRRLAEELGVNQTPTIIINNRRVNNWNNIETLGSVIEAATPQGGS